MVQQAADLGHQQGGIHALAGNIGQAEVNKPVFAPQKIVKIAGDFPRRHIHSHDRESVPARCGQQVHLDLPGQFQFLAHAFLFDQPVRHAGIVDCQCRR
ncbi:hypothetical protein D3C83_60980 [compost metagenome]